jgi:hypothetical protein
VLIDIAENDESGEVRREAVRKISNQDVLVNILENDLDPAVIRQTFERIGDKNLIKDVNPDMFLEMDWYETEMEEDRISIVKKIDDERSLTRIAKTYYPNSSHGSYGRTNDIPCGKSLDRDVNAAINILNRWFSGDCLDNTQIN